MEKTGRPPKFESAEELGQAIETYFAECEESQISPTIRGLAESLGISRRSLANWEEHEEFSDTVKKARARIENGGCHLPGLAEAMAALADAETEAENLHLAKSRKAEKVNALVSRQRQVKAKIEEIKAVLEGEDAGGKTLLTDDTNELLRDLGSLRRELGEIDEFLPSARKALAQAEKKWLRQRFSSPTRARERVFRIIFEEKIRKAEEEVLPYLKEAFVAYRAAGGINDMSMFMDNAFQFGAFVSDITRQRDIRERLEKDYAIP